MKTQTSRMRRFIRTTATLAVAGLAMAGTFTATTGDAHAASYYGKRCSGSTSGVTRGGDVVVLDRYRAYGMNCASVRYAAGHLRKRITRTWYGWPNVSFHDGYVRWRCGAFDNGGIDCDEYSSYTSFEVRKRVY